MKWRTGINCSNCSIGRVEKSLNTPGWEAFGITGYQHVYLGRADSEQGARRLVDEGWKSSIETLMERVRQDGEMGEELLESRRDWVGDYANGENQYCNTCAVCCNPFYGHKYRAVCVVCCGIR